MLITTLKALMKERGVTQERLAAHLGMSQSSISDLALGKRIPNAEQERRISQFLGVPLGTIWRLRARGGKRSETAA